MRHGKPAAVWEHARQLFKAGLTLRVIEQRTGIRAPHISVRSRDPSDPWTLPDGTLTKARAPSKPTPRAKPAKPKPSTEVIAATQPPPSDIQFPPPVEPDPEPDATEQTTPDISGSVAALAGFGLTDEEIAEVSGITLAELQSRYAAELKQGQPRLTVKIARVVAKIATDDNETSHTRLAAAKYWLDRRGGIGWQAKQSDAKGGVKAERQIAAEAAMVGKYATPKPPPLRLVK